MSKKHRTEKHAPAQSHEPVRAAGTSGSGAPAGAGQPVSPEEIRLRAYLKWEAAGRPGGDGLSFWVEAERELLQAR